MPPLRLNYPNITYQYDVAFTGAMDEPSTREKCTSAFLVCNNHERCPLFDIRTAHYPNIRRSMVCSISTLRAAGLRVINGMVDDYSLLVATTKIVPATTEHSLLGVASNE